MARYRIYELQGQTLRLLRDRVQYAKDHLIEIASDAGDVLDWNSGGHGYIAVGLLNETIDLLGQLLEEPQ